MSKNKVTFGLKKVHIAFLDGSGTTPIWETPFHIPGAVNLSTDPQGGESTFYADDTLYYTHTNNDGYTGDLQMALVPDEVLAQMLGWDVDSNGMIVETVDGEQKEFALMFETKGDKKNRRAVFYRCKASRPGKEHATATDTREPASDTLSLRVLPIEVGGKLIVKGVVELSDTNAPVYNAFFDEVIVPGASPSAVVKTELTALIALADTLTGTDYSVGSWSVLSNALATAIIVSEDTEATQAEVNQNVNALKTAILALVPEVTG